MTDTPDEANWRAEFERLGEDQVTRLVYSFPIPELKRQFGFRWLGEQASSRRLREERTYHYTLGTLIVGTIAATAALIAAWPVINAWFK